MDSTPNNIAVIDGVSYSIGRLSPKKSFHVARRLSPFLAAIGPHLGTLFAPTAEGETPTTRVLLERGIALLPSVTDVLSRMSDEDCDFVIDTCLAVVQIKQERGWAPVVSQGGQMMFDSINSRVMLQLAAEVVTLNLGDFFPTDQPEEAPQLQTATPQ